VRKDTVVLRELYHKAGVPEYWLVDARSDLRFDILHLEDSEYTPVVPVDGWLRSAVFDRWFQFSQSTDRLGHPQYSLASRDEP
jgi:Uma2 family endonuclease